MRLANIAVGAVLRSPIRGLLSRTTLLVRYEGRRSGRRVTTPTQYARVGNDLVIMVGGAGTKSWWRNFREEHRLDVLLDGEWQPRLGLALRGPAEAAVIEPLLAGYLAACPRMRAEDGVVTMVRCRPA
jgi:glycine cleavage system aminomethyltransferase T